MLFSWIFTQLMLIGIFEGCDAIYCGSYAKNGQFKYSVAIIQETDSLFKYCVGSIIDSTHILTAAHCFINASKTELSVIAGVVDLYSKSGVKRKVSKIHISKEFKFNGNECETWNLFQRCTQLLWNSQYNPEIYQIENDIAVLTLDRALPLAETIGTINLPDIDYLPYCQYCEYAGWGETVRGNGVSKKLRWTELLILKPEACDIFKFRHLPKQFCAMDWSGQSCPLSGDSGAALVYDNTIIGVTSYGGVNPTLPTVFSKVFDHLDFIREALKD